MSFAGDEDVQLHSSPLLQSAQQPADQLYTGNEDVDLASDYLSDAPSDRNPSLHQSSQQRSSPSIDPAADQPVAEDEHEDLLDEDSLDFPSVPSRSNIFRGPPSTWRNWTAPERGLAASLDQLQAKDLSIHLYNSFKLRERNGNRDPSQRARASKHSGKAKEKSQWIPPKVWTAWPMPPGIVPRELDERRWEEDDVPFELYHAEPKRPGQHLKELLIGQVLRKAKDRFRDRPWGDAQHPAKSTMCPPQQSQGGRGSFNGKLDTKQDKQVLQMPVVMANDQRASDILQPTVQHMMSKLDDLLMGLHHARSSYLSAEHSGSESQSQTSQRSTSRGRPQKRKREARKTEVDAEASRDPPDHPESDFNMHRPSRKNSSSKVRVQHTRPASRRSRVQDFRDRKGRLGLRDWSDVLAIASMTGWHQHVVESATSRCVNIFGEGIKFRTLEEGKEIQEEYTYLPGTSLPVGNTVSKSKSQDYTSQGREGSRSKFEGGRVGGVHVDGFLKPIEGKKSWLYSNTKKSKRMQRSPVDMMDDVNSPLNTFKLDMEMDIDEADPLSSGHNHRDPIVIDSGDDDGDESDTTLLGDDLSERRGLSPTSGARENGRQGRAQDVNFRELQSYTHDGHTIRIGRLIRDQEGNFLRVISIKQNRSSGNVAIEGLRDDHRVLQIHSYSGRTLRPGKTVELTDGAFVRIVSILEDRRTSEISLKGFRFQRAVQLAGLLPFKQNEVAMIMKVDNDDPRDILEQSTELFQLSTVVRIRQLVKTNQQYPSLNFRETDPESIELGKDYMSDHCRLVCRWNYLKINRNEGFLRRMIDIESDDGCSVPQYQLRRSYRGSTIKGGDSTGWLESEEAFDRKERIRCFCIDPFGFHSDSTDDSRNRRQQRRYTFGDGFCGAGGASRGAYGAGFRVEWGFDHDAVAIATYCKNFPHARCDGIAANDFVTAINEEYKIDVLHLSPPCQTFSPAHTRPGPNDEKNQATFLATEELIQKTRPRIVTLEETFGLTRTLDHLEWFNAMICMFTKLGFSVRWKVFNFLDFGLPQHRKRLFLFASCPGETLPDFPEPTHCKSEDRARFPHRSKFITVNDAIGRIPRNFPNHSPYAMRKLKRPRPRYSGNLPLRHTITCSGSINVHPSGTRCFTDRELACLQGFPLEHHFGPRGAKKQIGNAVPPVVAKVFFEQIVKALRIADGL